MLPRIFCNIIDTVITKKRRHNRAKGTKNYCLHEDIVELASQIGTQVFFEDGVHAMDLTQVVPIDQTQPRKKRRLDMTFQTCILDKLKRSSNEDEEIIVPWLQILAAMIPCLEGDFLMMQGMMGSNCF